MNIARLAINIDITDIIYHHSYLVHVLSMLFTLITEHKASGL